MPSDLLLIGKTGAQAARAALDVTAQNIANSSNANYSRRSLDVAELAATGGIGNTAQSRLAGVRIAGVGRSTSFYLQAEARRTGADLARAGAEIAGLKLAERAVEGSGVYAALVGFEAGLAALQADPLSTPLRTQVVQNAQVVTDTFRLAAQGLDASAAQLQQSAGDGTDRVNVLAAGIARTNANLAKSQEGSAGRAVLLDQRDALLADLAQIAGVSATFDSAGRATVHLGDAGGPVLVTGTGVETFAQATAADGTLSFTLGGSAVIPVSGELAGQASALSRIATLRGELDSAAQGLIAAVNSAQASGVAPDGSPGAPLLTGTGAADLALGFTSGAGLATAPAGSGANSRDPANLVALRAALANGGPTAALDASLFGLAGEISGRNVIRDALDAIAQNAASALSDETAVDLDSEAANLVRFQQAFQASGRVIQVANDIFDTLLAIR